MWSMSTFTYYQENNQVAQNENQTINLIGFSYSKSIPGAEHFIRHEIPISELWDQNKGEKNGCFRNEMPFLTTNLYATDSRKEVQNMSK